MLSHFYCVVLHRNLGLFHDIIAVDMSKDVISSIQRQLDGIVKTKEIYTTKELGFLKASLAGLQDVCRLSMGKFTFVFPDDEKSGDESEAKRREMLETLDMFMGLFKRIEVMNGTSDTSSVFAKCLHENSEFALAVITDNVSGKELKLTECSALARTVNGLAGYLRKLSVYSPVFSKYVKFYEPYCSLFSAFYEKTVVPFMVKENANKRGSYSATPLEFLMLYKRSTDLFKALKECGWTKPLPLIGELFVHHIVGWIWDCDEQFTKWNQRIIESETWTPISEDVYYSHSIIDIITYMSTAKEELAGLCFGVEEGPAAAGKYAEEIWKAYSLVNMNLVHVRVCSFFVYLCSSLQRRPLGTQTC